MALYKCCIIIIINLVLVDIYNLPEIKYEVVDERSLLVGGLGLGPLPPP